MRGVLAFTDRIGGFSARTNTYKVEVFGWYLHEVLNKDRFGPPDLTRCFEETHSTKPSNIHALLSTLCDRKPARLLRDSRGYRLSASTREELRKSLSARASSTETTALLASLIPRVTNTAQSVFLAEALACFNNGAFRAAIVMAWNLAYAHVCDQIYGLHLVAFNAQRHKAYPKLPELAKRTDFEDYKESQVIEICRGSRILDSSTCKILLEKLNKRNSAAHPSSLVITPVHAEEVIVDLVTNVLLNPAI